MTKRRRALRPPGNSQGGTSRLDPVSRKHLSCSRWSHICRGTTAAAEMTGDDRQADKKAGYDRHSCHRTEMEMVGPEA